MTSVRGRGSAVTTFKKDGIGYLEGRSIVFEVYRIATRRQRLSHLSHRKIRLTSSQFLGHKSQIKSYHIIT